MVCDYYFMLEQVFCKGVNKKQAGFREAGLPEVLLFSYGRMIVGLVIRFGLVAEIEFCLSYDNAGEGNECNKVRDCHETVYDIRENPDRFEFQEGTGGNQDDEDD